MKKRSKEKKDFFLCHSSDDKDEVVRPVANALRLMNATIWLDESELTVGDSLVGEIQSALTMSKFIVPFISKSFIEKGWPLEELFSSLSHQISEGGKRVLPVIIDIRHEDLRRSLPFIAEKLYLRWSDNPEHIARELLNALKRSSIECIKDSDEYNIKNISEFRRLVEKTYLFLRFDQNTLKDPFFQDIEAPLSDYEGGWGKSTFVCLEPLFGVPPTNLVKWQGGIATTSLVGTTMHSFENKCFLQNNPWKLPYLKLVANALIKAQHQNGGFGALVQARDGIEPHPSYRHTAAVITFLARYPSPRKVMSRAVSYLNTMFDIPEYEPIPDTCPALALAWTYEALRGLEKSGYVDSIKRKKYQVHILNTLSQIDDSYYPFWKPYAGSPKGIFWTTLSVLTVCSGVAESQQLLNRVKLIIEEFSSSMTPEGLPPYKDGSQGDIGMTSMLALALLKHSMQVGNSNFLGGEKLPISFVNLIEVLVDQRNNPKSFLYSWGESLFSLLEIAYTKGLIWSVEDRVLLDSWIEKALTHPDWRKGEVRLVTELTDRHPELGNILNNTFHRYPK